LKKPRKEQKKKTRKEPKQNPKNLKPEIKPDRNKKTQKKHINKTRWAPEPDLKPDRFRFGCQISPVGVGSGVKFNVIVGVRNDLETSHLQRIRELLGKGKE
jgi:hypothetical protein